MISGLLAKKIGMVQIFKDGKCHPVTVLQAGPCVVLQVKRKQKVGSAQKCDGYDAIQLGFEEKRIKSATQPELGHAKKHANTTPKKFVREVEWDGKDEVKPGDIINLSLFEKATFVDIIGTSKGKGFQGVMKRHGFKGLKITHGESDRPRAPGSIGSSAAPARVMKGKRMGGHCGNHRSTSRNLRISDLDIANNIIAVKGAVPGPNTGYVIITRSVRG